MKTMSLLIIQHCSITKIMSIFGTFTEQHSIFAIFTKQPPEINQSFESKLGQLVSQYWIEVCCAVTTYCHYVNCIFFVPAEKNIWCESTLRFVSVQSFDSEFQQGSKRLTWSLQTSGFVSHRLFCDTLEFIIFIEILTSWQRQPSFRLKYAVTSQNSVPVTLGKRVLS